MKWRVEGRTRTGEKTYSRLNWSMLYHDEKVSVIKRIVLRVLIGAVVVGLWLEFR